MEDDRWEAVGLSVAITVFLAVVFVWSGLYQAAALAGLIGGFLAVTFAIFGTEAEESATEEAASTAAVERDGTGHAASEHADVLETLRERYARGELDEAEFERKVEQLLETESVERAGENLGPAAGETDATDVGSASVEREPEYER